MSTYTPTVHKGYNPEQLVTLDGHTTTLFHWVSSGSECLANRAYEVIDSMEADNNTSVTTYKVINMYTGHVYTTELVKETKCYYIAMVTGLYSDPIALRFHKNTMHNDNLLLVVEEK